MAMIPFFVFVKILFLKNIITFNCNNNNNNNNSYFITYLIFNN